jgi:hypothetical protein
LIFPPVVLPDKAMDKEARSVSRAIALALALIAEHDPELALLLSKSIETGQYLSYSQASPTSLTRKATAPKENAISPGKEPRPIGRR